jgi:hypothetical protein
LGLIADPIEKLAGPPFHVTIIWRALDQLHSRADTSAFWMRLTVLVVRSLLQALPTLMLARFVAAEKSR